MGKGNCQGPILQQIKHKEVQFIITSKFDIFINYFLQQMNVFESKSEKLQGYDFSNEKYCINCDFDCKGHEM